MKNILILLTVITLFSSCGKDGAPGPQGPMGNANVTSTTFQIVPTAWGYITPTNGGLKYYEVTVNDAQITSDIVNNGSVSTFYSPDNINWNAMPWNDLQPNNWSISYESQYSTGGISFYIVPSDNLPITINNNYDTYFKVVAIAGSVKKKNPGTNWNDYKEVMNVMNQENK